MTQKEYLQELKFGLAGRLTETEIQDILDEYQGFFTDGIAEGRSEDEISGHLGSPAQLVRTLTEEKSGTSHTESVSQNTAETAGGYISKVTGTPFATLGQRIGAALIDRVFVLFVVILLCLTGGIISSVSRPKTTLTSRNSFAVSYSSTPNAAVNKQPITGKASGGSTIGMIYIFCLASICFPPELAGGAALFFAFFYPVSASASESTVSYTIVVLLIAAFLIVYKPVMESVWNGRTIGKRILGIRVASEDGSRAGAGSVFLRELIGDGLLGLLSGGITAVVSLFTIALSRPHKSIPDYLASTIVIADSPKKQSESAVKGTNS